VGPHRSGAGDVPAHDLDVVLEKILKIFVGSGDPVFSAAQVLLL
jgi:hypothetical protein